MRNARLHEAQAASKIVRRNINKLRYTNDTALMAESEAKQKTLLMKVREESEKVGKTNIQKTMIMAFGHITSLQIDWETMERERFIWWWLGGRRALKITADGDFSCEIKGCLLLGRKAMASLNSILKAEIFLCRQRFV